MPPVTWSDALHAGLALLAFCAVWLLFALMCALHNLTGQSLRGARVIDCAGGEKWNCRCVGCGMRFVAAAQVLLTQRSSPTCPRCRGPLWAAYGRQGGLIGQRGHYVTTCGRARRVYTWLRGSK